MLYLSIHQNLLTPKIIFGLEFIDKVFISIYTISMFKSLMDFGYKRTIKQAIGFYLAYFTLTVLISALVAGIVALIINSDSFGFGVRIGNIVAILMSVLLSLLVVNKKKLFNNFWYVVLIIISGLLAILLGALAGLIPAAYLTTKQSNQTT